jgi:hypothetical protein
MHVYVKRANASRGKEREVYTNLALSHIDAALSLRARVLYICNTVTRRLHTFIMILAAAAKNHPIVVDTPRRATIHRQWIDSVLVGIIR